MKKLYLLLSVLLGATLLVGAGCTQTSTTNTNTVDDDAMEDVMEKDDDAMMEEHNDEDEHGDDEEMDFVSSDEETSEEESEEGEEETVSGQVFEVGTQGNTFTNNDLTISVGDSVAFDLGPTHNLVQVSEADWNANKSTALSGGISVGFGENQTLEFQEAGTYYYVCQPHVGVGMKGKVVVE